MRYLGNGIVHRYWTVPADKTIDLMDEAAAKLRLEMDSMPVGSSMRMNRKIMQLEIEREAIRRKDKEKCLNKVIARLSESAVLH